MSGPRVCEVVKTLDASGVETLLVERLSRTPGANASYTVVCLGAFADRLAGRLLDSGIRVVNVQPGPRALVYARLIRAVRRLGPDVVNVHSPVPAIVLRPAVRLARRRPALVSTVHHAYRTATRPIDRVTAAGVALLDRLTRRLDDRTVAVSSLVARAPSVRGARRLLTRLHGVDVEVQRFWAARAPAVRREFGVPRGAFVVACVAGFHPWKNHRMLVQAAAQVLAERRDTVFLLAGGGPLLEDTARDVCRRGLADRVRVLGPVPDARRLVAAADLLVLASDCEGLPVVVMEALAAGVPVVSTDVGEVPELVVSGGNGILTEPGSAAALAAGIVCAAEPGVHRRLRAGALATSRQVDLEGTAEWFDDLYRDLHGEMRGARPRRARERLFAE
ncbi:glycosyltransferase [Microbispora corallina]|uniref:Glycosyl transferase n=1 Tax=Microbispora corallina TaxID=83302 RepID=A0ABQ4G6I8_9ACTN|nr:glycosyltransferase [Microbispora corallina]GIH42686.1 glycosyl transferase [Microbispora corallina]